MTGFAYRCMMKLAHRFNWHYAPAIHIENDTQLWCKWCGFRQTIARQIIQPYQPTFQDSPHLAMLSALMGSGPVAEKPSEPPTCKVYDWLCDCDRCVLHRKSTFAAIIATPKTDRVDPLEGK